MRPYLVAVLACVLSVLAKAQPASSLTAVLVDTTGAPLAAAVVTAYTATGETAPFVTDTAGRACCLPAAPLLDSLVVQHLGLGAVSVRPPFTLVGDSLLLVTLAGRNVRLPDATVVARYSGVLIRGDTVRFDAQRFADGRERDVADLLRQLPGIEVEDGGRVTYLGRPVQRFLLNGKDVLQSQFSVLNDLLGSGEIVNAELITERVGATAQEQQVLNLETKPGGKDLRADGQLGLTSRLDGIAQATALYLPEEGWQLFGKAGYDGSGGSIVGYSDARRTLDQGLDAVRGEVAMGGPSGYSSANYFFSQQAARRDHYAALASATRTNGARKTALAARYYHTEEVERGREELFDARTGDTLALLSRRRDRTHQVGALSASHTEAPTEALTLGVYGGLALDAERTDALGTNRFDVSSLTPGTAPAAYAFRQNRPRYDAYLVGTARLRIAEKTAARVTFDRQGSREVADYGLGDGYDVYGVAGLADGPARHDLSLDTRRHTDRTTADARVRLGSDTAHVSLATQYRRRRWAERLDSDPESRFETAGELTQTEDTYTVAVQPSWVSRPWRIRGTAGVDFVEYTRGEVAAQRTAPRLVLNVNRDITPALSMDFRVHHATEGYHASKFFQTVRPEDTRSFTEGTELRQPFTRSTYLTVSPLLRLPDRGLFVNANFNFAFSDTTITYLPRRERGYVAFVPVLGYGYSSANVNGGVNYQKGQTSVYVHGLIDISHSTIDPSAPTAYEQRRGFVSAGVDLRPAPWLEISPGYNFRADAQTTAPDGAESITTRLTTHSPNLDIRLRGKRFYATVGGSARFGSGVPTLYVLDASVQYRHPSQPFELTLRGSDLLNYARSEFRALQLGPGNLRATTFQRLPGYVALVAKYTWGQAK